MAKYVFECEAGHQFIVLAPMAEGPGPNVCPRCTLPARRNYRAEGVTVPGNDREVDPSLFLPMAADFAGPGDPDGMKGLRKWREQHRPMHKEGRHPEVG